MNKRDCTLCYDTVGSGPTSVVLLHGLFGRPHNWRSVMEGLAEHYRFLALQLPIDPHENRRHKDFHAIRQLTDHVERFFDELSLDQAVLCGNSLGGQVAIDYCLRHPGRVKALVLTGSAGLFEHNITGGKGLRYCRRTIREQAQQIFHDPIHVTEELVEDVYGTLRDRQYRRFIIKVCKATRDHSVLEDLADLDVPTMIIWGRNDRITPASVAEQFRQQITRAQLAYIDECGHSPPIEQPQQFARLLHAFVGDVTSC